MIKKNILDAFIIILMILVVIGVYINSPIQKNKKSTINTISTIEEVYNIDGLVFFGKENCEACKNFFPLLKEKASIYQTKLYYFDTDKFRENENFNKILNKYHVSSVPMVVKLSNGKYSDSMVYDYLLDKDSQEKIIDQFLVNNITTEYNNFLFYIICIYFLLCLYISFSDSFMYKIALLLFNIIVPVQILYQYGAYIDIMNYKWSSGITILIALNILITLILLIKRRVRKNVYNFKTQ